MKKRILKMSLVLVAFVLIMLVPKNIKAAQFKLSPQGKSTKCGSYYIKYNSKGLYKKKSGGSWKLIVKASSKYAYPSFTSDGKTIYYASNAKRKGVIYKISVSGKNKKAIYNAKHNVRVIYYYNGKICYCSDIYGDSDWETEFDYAMYVYNTKNKAYKKLYEVYGTNYFEYAYKNSLVLTYGTEDGTSGFEIYNIDTYKCKSKTFDDMNPKFKYASKDNYVYVGVLHKKDFGSSTKYIEVYRYSNSSFESKKLVSNLKASSIIELKPTYVKYKSTSGSVIKKKF